MGRKNLIMTIVADQGYIHNSVAETSPSVLNESLFTAISETYIPLLNMLSNLKSEGISFKLGLVLSAPLCTNLSNPQFQKQYTDWLEKRIELGNKELARNSSNEEIKALIQAEINKTKKDIIDFTETYNQDLVKAFSDFAREGYLELTATCATHAFLPHYADLPEVLNAQIETGLYAQRHFFGEAGEGFYLPYLGWAKGLEKSLRSYGVNYTIVDTRSFLFADTIPESGIFEPVRTGNSLVLFARDPDSPDDILGEEGYASNPVYRNQLLDLGFDLNKEELSSFLEKDEARTQTLFKYWAKGDDDEEEIEDRQIYQREKALQEARKDAADFYAKKSQKLSEAAQLLGEKDAVLTCVLPAEILGQSWHEGITWLETVIRLTALNQDIQLAHCRDFLKDQFKLPKIEPYACAARGTGYGEDLLDSSNSWMLRYIRKASERMIDLTERFPSETGLKARLLDIGAREVLLAQSGDWPAMLTENRLPDFASESFRNSIISFTTVFDSLASNSVSTEWLTNLEKKNSIFPWINYRIFSRKK